MLNKEQSKLENYLNIQNDKQTILAYGFSNKVIPFKQVDDELIQEYNKHFPTSFGDVIDENGVKKQKKFLAPELQPVLDTFQPAQLFQTYNEATIQNIYNDLQSTEEELVSSMDMIYRLNNLVDTTELTANELQELDRQKVVYQRREAQLRNTIRVLTQEIKGDSDLKEQNKLIEEQNKNQEISINKSNKYKLATFNEEMKMLNKGIFNVERLPDETDDDYRDRLTQSAEILVPMEKEEEMKVLTRQLFRKNLKTIIKNPVIIDSVANGVDEDIDHVDNKLELNKVWKSFSELFKKRYGVFNALIDASDILSFMKQFLNNEFLQTTKAESFESKSKETKQNMLEGNANGDVYIFNKIDESPVYLKASQDSPNSFILYYSFDDFDYNLLMPASFQDIELNCGLSPDDFKRQFRTKVPKTIARYLLTKYNIRNSSNIPVRMMTFKKRKPQPQELEEPDEPTEKSIGKGLKLNIDKVVHLGKCILNLQKLYYNNILSITDSSGGKVPGIQNKRVSDLFASLLMKIINNESVSISEINMLSKDEKILYNLLIYHCGLAKKVNNDKDSTISELKKELKLLEGEISAGNNNPSLKKRLYNVCYSLKNLGVLSSVSQIKQYLAQFN
jgi:hypothetical protein